MQTDGFRDLLRCAQAEEQPAIERLFELALPLVQRVVKSPAGHLAPGDSGNELAQRVCLRLFVKLKQFRGADEAASDDEAWRRFTGWVRQVVHSEGVNRATRERRHAPLPPPGDSSTAGFDPPSPERSPSSVLGTDEQKRLVVQAIEQLPPEVRAIVRLRFYDGLTLREIAAREQLTYDQVRYRFEQGMEELERLLGTLP